MDGLIETLVTLETPEGRRHWLQEQHPKVNHAFIQRLQELAQQLENADNRKAKRIAQVVTDAAELWDDRQTLAAALRITAQSLRAAEPSTALYKYQEAIQIYQNLGLPDHAADAAVGLVAALRSLGRYDEAATTNQWVIDQFRTSNNRFGLARALLNQGLLAYFQGQFTAARAHYAEAHALFTQLGQSQWCAAVASNDANVLEELNQFAAAQAQYTAARADYAAAQLHNAVARVDHNLAYLHFSLGDYQQALHLFATARRQFADQASVIDVAFVDLYRSEIYLALTLWRKALDLAKTAREVFERAQMPWETAQVLINEAMALYHLAKPELALERLAQARRLLAQAGFAIWQGVVDLYESHILFRLKAYDRAEELALSARQRFQSSGLARRSAQCDVLLGQVALAQGQMTQATTYFAAAQQGIGEYAWPAVAYCYHWGWGQVCRRQGKIDEAYSHYRQAIAAIESLQNKIGAEDYKTAFLSDKSEVYEEFIEFCLEQRQPAADREAFETLERAKISTLGASLSAVALPQPAGASEPALVASINQLKRELNRYYTQFHTPENGFANAEEAKRLHKNIVQCEQRLSNLLDSQRQLDSARQTNGAVTWLSLPALQATLPPATTILAYFLTADQLTIFCVERHRFSVQRARVAAATMRDLVRQFTFQISKFQLDPGFRTRHQGMLQQSMDLVLNQFYQLLIAPVAGLLEDAHQLIIIPYHLLYNLPFHAFFDGKKYLLEEYGVSYALSATFHQQLCTKQPSRPLHPPLILGLNDGLIGEAEAEATAVAQVFPAAALRLGADATTGQLLQNQQPRAFIHLATHGAFRSDNPAFSALKLADGWLTLQELMTLQWSAPLITLSACETGRSEILLGDKLVGFYRGFFSAGAQALVATLWALDDTVATQLMVAFYRSLKAGHPVDQALRMAQLAIMATLRHPYYWAPFILTGNPALTIAEGDAIRTAPSNRFTHRSVQPLSQGVL